MATPNNTKSMEVIEQNICDTQLHRFNFDDSKNLRDRTLIDCDYLAKALINHQPNQFVVHSNSPVNQNTTGEDAILRRIGSRMLFRNHHPDTLPTKAKGTIEFFLYEEDRADADADPIIEPWDTYFRFVARIDNEMFVYGNCFCDHTGFDCQGGGDLFCHTNATEFWNNCLDEVTRQLLLPTFKLSPNMK